MNNLLWRLASAFLLLPIIFFLGYLGGWALWSLILIFGAIALWELCRLLNLEKLDFIPVFFSFLLFLSNLRLEIYIPLEVTLALSLLISAIYILAKGGPNRSIRVAVFLFAPIYLGFLLRFIYLLREGPKGFYLLTLFLLSTFANDTVAYFVGKYWGRVRIFPKISPGKTLEGTLASPIGGVIGAVVTALIFGQPLLKVIPLGILVSLFALLGDLFESIFKREAQKKDSSNLIPGHGGFLDRLDSLLFTAPLVYFYSVLFMI
ncbi:MAG: phosphatidate cytidylyltransferase [Coprothermobacterota bacterium]|nr:phosphatidate cytidylyltransferase [Coprothermobacterota bacterium]